MAPVRSRCVLLLTTFPSLFTLPPLAFSSSQSKPPLSSSGLGFIPALPFLFDEPVEHVVDATFDRIERSLYPDENSPVRRALEACKHHAVTEEEVEPKTVGGDVLKAVVGEEKKNQ
jgi:hypothetical protein